MDADPREGGSTMTVDPGERGWRHRHLLDVAGLDSHDLDLVMRTADEMRRILARPIPKVPALRGLSVTILFYEASTRTRVSFEVAAKNLSADVVNIAAASSSVAKGESLIDTVRTVEALGADVLVMRHGRSGAPDLAARVFGGHVINAGDGWHAHPTQALLDLYTLRDHLPHGDLRGRKVVIVGDILHSRVARSNVWSLTTAGADVWLCGPATLLRGFEPLAAALPASRRLTVTTSIDAALAGADAVMALAAAAGTDVEWSPAVSARVRRGLSAERRTDGGRRTRRHRAPSRTDERGRRDRARPGCRWALGHHRAGRERRRRADGSPVPPCPRAGHRGGR